MIAAPDLERVQAARARTAGIVRRTPALPLQRDGRTLWLKLEVLQPIASFKLRGASAAVTAAPAEATSPGLLTASAGNMAQGAAWMARHLGVPCSVVVPDTAPDAKLERIAELGGSVIPVGFDRWWQTFVDRSYPARWWCRWRRWRARCAGSPPAPGWSRRVPAPSRSPPRTWSTATRSPASSLEATSTPPSSP